MRATILTTALGCLVLTAACDDSTAPGSELSAEEARAVALAVDDAGTSAVDSNPQGPSFNLVPSRASRDIITHSGSFDVTGA